MIPFLLACLLQDRVDTHVHLHGPGRGTKEDFERAARELVARMEKIGVRKTIVLPPPAGAEMRRLNTHRDFLDAVRRHPGRLYFLGGGGELNSTILKVPADRVTSEIRAEFERQAESILKDGARGFGEMAALHLSLQEGHPFEEVSPDHPLFLLLAEIAAKHDVPIDLHMDAVPEETGFPAHLRRIQHLNPRRLQSNVAALEKLLAHRRGARIVWQHAGSDPVLGMSVENLRRLLKSNENLFVSIRVPRADFRSNRGPGAANALLGPDGELRSDWRALLKEFPDRFLLGSDFFQDGFGGTESLEGAWSILEKLPAELAKKIGGGNAVKVYRLD